MVCVKVAPHLALGQGCPTLSTVVNFTSALVKRLVRNVKDITCAEALTLPPGSFGRSAMHKVLDGCQFPATLRDVLPPKRSTFSVLTKPFERRRSSATGQAARREPSFVDEMVLRQLQASGPIHPIQDSSRSQPHAQLNMQL